MWLLTTISNMILQQKSAQISNNLAEQQVNNNKATNKEQLSSRSIHHLPLQMGTHWQCGGLLYPPNSWV